MRCTDAGWSGLIDPRGRIIETAGEIESMGPCFLGAVPLGSGVTPYARFGDWLPVACIAASEVLVMVSLLAKEPPRLAL